MSDASSVVTYTSVYTDSEPWRYYEEDSAETGPSRVIVYGYDGLPIQPVAPPSSDCVLGPEHQPSPDYVPGPEHPPSPVEIPYVPEPEYPEYLVPSNDEAPLEDPDYPADGGDGDDDPSDDDDDDDIDDEDLEEEPLEEDDEEEEEEEHLAQADSSAVLIVDLVLPAEGAPLGYRTAEIRMRALFSSTSHRTDILEADMPPRKGACLTTLAPGFEIEESSTAGAIVDTLMEIAPTTLDGVNERVTELDTSVRKRTDEFEICFEEAQDDRALLRARVNTLFRDKPDHRRTAMLMDREAMYSRKTWSFFMDKSSAIAAHVRTLETQVLEARDPEPQEGPAEAGSSCVAAALAKCDADRNRNGDNSNDSETGGRRQMTTPRECTYTDFLKCQPMSFHGSEGVVGLTRWIEKMESIFQISNYTVTCQVKFASCTLQGSALTWWNSHIRAVRQDVAYAMPWAALKRMITSLDLLNYNHRFQELSLMCERMFPEEAAKVERYIGGLPDKIHGSVKASKPQSMQKAIEFATELMDKKMLTHAERQVKQNRKLDDTLRNNQHQQQPFKRNNVARAYTAGPGDKKPYGGTKPLCSK
nr:hypothetical protein [Tanacetum cinerariifolium]